MSELIYKTETVLGGILDTDFYKISMCNAVLTHYPDAMVKYKFTNRNLDMVFSERSFELIKSLILGMGDMRLSDDEYEGFKLLCPQFSPMFYEYIKSYRFDPEQIKIQRNKNGELKLEIDGPWHSTILWEVPLMAVISFAYFKYTDTDWNMDDQERQSIEAGVSLHSSAVSWTDFGTRRRRNYDSQSIVVRNMNHVAGGKGFLGTSNVHLALEHKVGVLGTFAHEWIMGVSALESLQYANRFAMEKWQDVYKGDLGIALTDTFGTEAFFKDFTGTLSKSYVGVRHDSGCPHEFAQKVIDHYQKLDIDPKSKIIIFSDGLNVGTATDINMRWGAEIQCMFGIGTTFTNNFKNSAGEKSNPLNMVIKLYSVDGIPVVKLSDNPMKATGEQTALKIAKNIFFGEKLMSEICKHLKDMEV